MNRKLLLVLIVLFLTACGTRTVRDDSPASDLDALEVSVSGDLKPRTLPNGKEFCAELARTEQAQDECLGDLEDVVYTSNRDKERALGRLQRGFEWIRWRLNPCRWYQFSCKARIKELQRDSAN